MASKYDTLRAKLAGFYQPNQSGRSGREEELRTSPLFSVHVMEVADAETAERTQQNTMAVPSCNGTSTRMDVSDESEESEESDEDAAAAVAFVKPTPALYQQYSVLGHHIGDAQDIRDKEPVLLNVDAPNSTFICGSQGSGKSYTMSCILESCLLKDATKGKVTKPVAGVVFHYDTNPSASSVAETAHLCSLGIKVNVLVPESNEYTLKQAYQRLPGASANLQVNVLKMRSRDLSVDRMMKLMAFEEKDGAIPLYMSVIQKILKDMAIENQAQMAKKPKKVKAFDYGRFKALVESERLSNDQKNPLALRFGLLESFLDLTGSTYSSYPSGHFGPPPGTLTIVDLSDPFVDASSARLLFDICLGLFLEKRNPSGLVIALDEAHKFMNGSGAASRFTDHLLTTIREQRHNASRVIIATQEPTVSKDLLGLCSTTIVHRFSSPAWFDAIRGNLGAASKLTQGENEGDLFREIINLQVGESLLFSPASFLRVVEYLSEDGNTKEKASKLGASVMKMMTRSRGAGSDGGKSLLASSFSLLGLD